MLVVTLSDAAPARFIARSEPDPNSTVVAVDILDTSDTAEAPGPGAGSGTRAGTAEPAGPLAEPSPARTIAPRVRTRHPRERAIVTTESQTIESSAADAETAGGAAPTEADSAETASAPALQSAGQSEEPATFDGTGAGETGGDGASPGGGGSRTTTTTPMTQTEPSPATDPCGAPWTGVWEGHSRAGAFRHVWTEFRLTLEQRGERIAGVMFERERQPNETSTCEFQFLAPHAELWHATTTISGLVGSDGSLLVSEPGRVEDYVVECGLPEDYFTRDWGDWDWVVRFHLRIHHTGQATGTWDVGRHGSSRFGVASIHFTRTACSP